MKSPASRFTRLIAGLGTAATVVAGFAPTAANASDGKDYTALNCRPYYSSLPEAPTTITGIYHTLSYSVSYVCPVIHDEGGSGISSAVVYFSTAYNHPITCSLYSTSPTGAYRAQTRTSSSMAGRRSLTFGAIAGYTNGMYSIICNIHNRSQLYGYTINEG